MNEKMPEPGDMAVILVEPYGDHPWGLRAGSVVNCEGFSTWCIPCGRLGPCTQPHGCLEISGGKDCIPRHKLMKLTPPDDMEETETDREEVA